jgi:hypothetical protein
MTLKIFVNLTMTLKIFINLITTLKMFINFIGNIFYREYVTRILINKVSFLLLKKSPSVLTLYSGNILKCPPEQSWKCSLALIIVR